MERAVWRWCGLIHLALVACSQANRDYTREPNDGGQLASSPDPGDDGGASKHDASVESRPDDAGTPGWSSTWNSGASADSVQMTSNRDASVMSHDGSAETTTHPTSASAMSTDDHEGTTSWLATSAASTDGGPISSSAGDGVETSAPGCVRDEVQCDNECVDLQTSPHHCGDCGHGCGGAECIDGRCAPQAVAEGQDGAFSIALTPDGNGVFWVLPSLVRRCPAAGCPANGPVKVADSGENLVVRPYVLAVDDTTVAWISTSSFVSHCPAAGCTFGVPTTAEMSDSGRELAQFGSNVYVLARFSASKFDSLTFDSAEQSTCVRADSARSLAVTESALVWLESTDPAGMYSCDRDDPSSSGQRLTSLSGLVVRVLDDVAYVLASTKVYSCPLQGCSGIEHDLVTGLTAPTSMAIDATGIYFTEAGSETEASGAVLMCPLEGCTGAPEVVAAAQARPTSIHLAGGFVYWANQGLPSVAGSGAIMRAKL